MTTKTITLRKPITVGKDESAVTYTEVVLREPTAGEYEDAEKVAPTYGLAVALIAGVSGVPIDVCDLMFTSQIDEAEDFIGSFGASVAMPTTASPDEIKIELYEPVKITEEDTPLNIASLSLSEPTNNQKRKAGVSGGSFATSISMISLNAGVPRGSVRRLCSRDFLRAVGYFNGFQLRRLADSSN
jgi:hypothetical protein